jgi:hypothetical protein
MFVESAFADAPETRVALFRRTFGQKVLTDANGLVSSPDTAEKEMVEEYTPILESADGKLTVLAVKIGAAHTPFTDAQLLAVKRAQEAKIRENLGGYVGALHYGVATLQELPMKKNTLSLKDGEGNIIETMSGSIGFEHDNNTWVYRKAGLLRVPNEFSIKLVDGEFERKGDFYTPEQLEKIIQSNDALSSTCAFGNEFLKQWPRASRTAALPDPRPDIR